MIDETLPGNLAPQTPGSGYLLGYNTSGLGALILLGTNLSMTGNTLNATGGGPGTVTSVQIAGANGLTFSGGPITTAGTITLGGVLGVAGGGLNITSVTTGDIIYGSATNIWSKLSAAASGNVLLSGTTPSWGKVSLASHVSAILPVGNGGTGLGGSFTVGDLLYASGPFTLSMRPIGSTGQVLTVVGGQPAWADATGGGGTGTVTSFSAGAAGTLFTTNVATATTTPALSFTLNTQSANTLYSGPVSGAAAAPTFRLMTLTDLPFEVVEIVSGTSYTFIASDNKKTKYFTNAAGVSLNFPTGLPVGWTAGIYRGVGAGTLTLSSSGTLESAGTTIDTPKTGAYVVHRGSDIHMVAGAVGSTAGIINTAADNELPKSSGGNLIPSGVFVTTNGNINMGSGSLAGNRTITMLSSDSTSNLTIKTKGNVPGLVIDKQGAAFTDLTNSAYITLGGATDPASFMTITTNSVNFTEHIAIAPRSGTTLVTSPTGSDVQLNIGGLGGKFFMKITSAASHTISGGTGAVGASGVFLIQGADGSGSNVGGASVTLRAGNGSPTNANGGILLLQAGAKAGTGIPGNIMLDPGIASVFLPNTTTVTTVAANTVQFYSKDVNSSAEFFVTNEAGIETCLSTLQFNRQTANYVLVLADAGKDIEMNVAGANTVTVPLNATVAFPIGTVIGINQYGAGQTALVAAGGVTIRSDSGFLKIGSRYSGAVLKKVGTDEWYLQGNLVA